MDKEHALAELAIAHAVAIRLADGGARDAEIARILDVPVESVPGLLGIARAKLASLISTTGM